MCLLPSDLHFLHRALDLAEAAASLASPNPTVGCVLVQNGTVVGEGAHEFNGRDHAEIVALKAAAAAGLSVSGATAFVTLEPCSHHGRTGPCADALVRAGISRCVVATTDPNPLVRGKGLAKLRNAGVAVHLLPPTSPAALRARRLNDAFAFAVQHGRPMVTLKAALSLDGKLAPDPSTRDRRAAVWLTGPAAREDVQHLRHAADALLTGIGTILSDNPQLNDRTGRPRRRSLLRVVLDPSLRLPVDSFLVQNANDDLLVVCDEAADIARQHALTRFRLEVIRFPQLVSTGGLAAVLSLLAQREIRSVLVEAGAKLNGSLLQADLVSRLVLYFADRELGQNAVPFAANGISPYGLQQQLTGQDRATFPHGNTEDVRVTGYLHDPWAGL